jgi:hypothetical protein
MQEHRNHSILRKGSRILILGTDADISESVSGIVEWASGESLEVRLTDGRLVTLDRGEDEYLWMQ